MLAYPSHHIRPWDCVRSYTLQKQMSKPLIKTRVCTLHCWGWAASYQPPPKVAHRRTTSRYWGQLRTKQTLAVWRISSGRPAAAVSSEHGGGSQVALSTVTKYPHSPLLLDFQWWAHSEGDWSHTFILQQNGSTVQSLSQFRCWLWPFSCVGDSEA